KGHHRSEFRYGNFARRIPLPEDVSEEQVTASYVTG
ncbi:MAG: Hsp20/alpha crystallin family protein, partial [Mycobacterium leprae]